jgi:hypothetical protein
MNKNTSEAKNFSFAYPADVDGVAAIAASGTIFVSNAFRRVNAAYRLGPKINTGARFLDPD